MLKIRLGCSLQELKIKFVFLFYTNQNNNKNTVKIISCQMKLTKGVSDIVRFQTVPVLTVLV